MSLKPFGLIVDCTVLSVVEVQYNISYMRGMRRDSAMHCLYFIRPLKIFTVSF